MKIAAGCFGCLAFVFLILTFTWGMIVAAIMPMLPTDLQISMGPALGYVQYLNSGCCCLSGVGCIALLVAGSMRSREPIE